MEDIHQQILAVPLLEVDIHHILVQELQVEDSIRPVQSKVVAELLLLEVDNLG